MHGFHFILFSGILLGIAIRTRKPIALNFCPMVWKLIANCALTWKDLEDVDLHYARSLKALYSADSAGRAGLRIRNSNVGRNLQRCNISKKNSKFNLIYLLAITTKNI